MLKKLNQKLANKNIQILLFIIFSAFFIILFLQHALLHKSSFIDQKFIIDCKSTLETHRVIVTKDKFNPAKVEAKQCDQLTFINQDKVSHKIAFGEHSNHLVYPGFRELVLRPGQVNTFTLVAYGSFQFHDHFNDDLKGLLVVAKK